MILTEPSGRTTQLVPCDNRQTPAGGLPPEAVRLMVKCTVSPMCTVDSRQVIPSNNPVAHGVNWACAVDAASPIRADMNAEAANRPRVNLVLQSDFSWLLIFIFDGPFVRYLSSCFRVVCFRWRWASLPTQFRLKLASCPSWFVVLW